MIDLRSSGLEMVARGRRSETSRAGIRARRTPSRTSDRANAATLSPREDTRSPVQVDRLAVPETSESVSTTQVANQHNVFCASDHVARVRAVRGTPSVPTRRRRALPLSPLRAGECLACRCRRITTPPPKIRSPPQRRRPGDAEPTSFRAPSPRPATSHPTAPPTSTTLLRPRRRSLERPDTTRSGGLKAESCRS